MHSWNAYEDPRLRLWQRVREFAVPPPMIESATARRAVGDWAGACAAARVDVDVNLRAVAVHTVGSSRPRYGPICAAWLLICCAGTCPGRRRTAGYGRA